MLVRFTWEADKADANERKHGVTFIEGASAFWDPLSITFPDRNHSWTEQRVILIGHSNKQHLVVVAHVERGNVIRIISARPATRRERKAYEEGEESSGRG